MLNGLKCTDAKSLEKMENILKPYAIGLRKNYTPVELKSAKMS